MTTQSRESLSPAAHHALNQTFAAEALEGWQPTPAQIDALVALAHDEVSYADYLSAHRNRYPHPEPLRRQRIFRRSHQYLIPGTTLLRNNFGASSQEMLADLEFVATAGRILQWHRMLIERPPSAPDIDIRAIHQHVFADVYPWAGRYRTTELRIGDNYFGRRSRLNDSMARINTSVQELAATGTALSDAALGYELARLYAEYNAVHPFREGNGRTGNVLLHTIAASCGRLLDLSKVGRRQWYSASRDSMPFRRDGQPNHRPLLPLFAGAIVTPQGR